MMNYIISYEKIKMKKSRFKTKLTKIQKRKNILVIFAVIVASYIFCLLFSRGIGIFEKWTVENLIIAFFLTFFVISMTLIPVLIAACVLGVQRGKAKRVRDNATFVPVQGIEYYRDSLSELNPALVSLLIDLDIYGKKDIVATLLRLQNKKAISFQKNGKIIATSENKQKLDQSEIELLNIIKGGKLNNKNTLLNWKKNRFNKAEQLGYIEKNTVDRTKNIGKYSIIAFVSLIPTFILWGIFLSLNLYDINNLFEIIIMFLFLMAIDVFLFVPWYLLVRQAVYFNRDDILWKRTPLGNEIAEKIAGLAKFIHEFSRLSEAEKEEIVLWDDYLVYAIVLEENEQIVKEICKSYKIDIRSLGRL